MDGCSAIGRGANLGAGPREESLGEMARRLVTRRGEQVRIEVVSNPADPDRELYENGALLPGPHAILAGPTFEEWLYNEEQTKPTTSS